MVRLEDILEKVTSYNPSADLDLIKKAYVFSAMVHEGQSRLSGEPYLNHPLGVAHIIAGMEMDSVAVATGLLHDTVEDTHTALEKIKELFGDEVTTLVDGLTKLSKMTFDNSEDREAESFRKMLIAMAKDIRIIVIKLADRLHNMRTLDALPPQRQVKIAQETLDIYAPLANRLGIGWVKTELEDLAFKYSKPVEYRMLTDRLVKEDEERIKYINELKDIIEKKLGEHNLKAVVNGRPKHLYGIYKKMEGEKIELEHIYDIVGFRIIVDTIKECYETLGIVHSCWKPIPGRFKDYIALPKSNMYQSIHTAVIGPYGDRMEVQIRTHDMHRVAEDGIASHWKYKEGISIDKKDDKRFTWLRQLLEWQKEMKDSGEFIETVKVDLFPEEVFVFTPKGDIKEFPDSSTIVDFAYAIHTDIGNRCTGARVNGRIVPLKYRLRNGDMIEILTSQSHNPSKDWLRFAVTSRARNRIRQWIKTEERTKSIVLGREICEKEFKRNELDFNKMLKSGELEKHTKEIMGGTFNIEKLLANVGYGKLSVHHLINKILPPEKLLPQSETGLSRFIKIFQKEKKKPKDAIVVRGVDDIMIKFARCCAPLPGDEIVGFITIGKGVTIHSSDCPNTLNMDPDRRIEVEWEKDVKSVRPATIEVICLNEKGLLSDISSAISSTEANISNANIKTVDDNRAVCQFEIEVDSQKHLNSIIKSLQKIRKVIKVQRLQA
ncbi:MAG: bifunctional (p)ppGpp synthetase/guanosine-3',5'-bis(diphosphate) 3'-pyrophosphohydrolase [Thermodesulfobacteriota bacterium]